MDWFIILLAVTTVVRGLGAGLIYDVAWISLPLRRKIGIIPYARYANANFKEGVKTYAPISIVGALLTIAVTISLFTREISPVVFWSVMIALIATVLAFIGTSRALPALMSIRKAPEDEDLLSKAFDRFAYWHSFSTIWQVVSFLALIVALTYR
jgi:hypothetical protein